LQQITAEQGMPIAMSELFLRDVMARTWRGNVRELRAYLEHAVVMSDGGILDQPLSTNDSAVGAEIQLASTTATLPTLHSVVEDAERGHIRKALTHCDGSVGKTADVLGISRKTLWEKMKRLAISA
jgi:DNA-binding NtrC family response regulator